MPLAGRGTCVASATSWPAIVSFSSRRACHRARRDRRGLPLDHQAVLSDLGSTAAERSKRLPGDEIVPYAGGQTTRAITIHAPIEDAWPWLAQLGQDRGGFYSFDLLENAVGCQMPTVDVLRAHHQVWQLGDKLWMYPSDQAGGVGFATLHYYQPGRVLGFATRAIGTSLDHAEDGSWTFVLKPVNPQTTRLVVRGRGAARPSLLGAAFDRTIFEPVHFVMERRMMMGVKQLAETGTRNRRLNHIHILLWTVTLGLFVVAAIMVVRRADWKGALLGLVAAAVAFQILTLAQPPLIVGVLLVGLTGWVLFRPDGRPIDARTPSDAGPRVPGDDLPVRSSR